MTTTYSVTAPVPQKPARPFENLFSRQSLPLPAIIFMIVVTQIPLILTLRYSLERWNLLRPERRAFIWFNNYINILENRDFWTIILNTLVLTLSVVILSLILGMLLALLLNREFPGRNIVRTMLITPFLIMPTVSAVLWKPSPPYCGRTCCLTRPLGYWQPSTRCWGCHDRTCWRMPRWHRSLRSSSGSGRPS